MVREKQQGLGDEGWGWKSPLPASERHLRSPSKSARLGLGWHPEFPLGPQRLAASVAHGAQVVSAQAGWDSRRGRCHWDSELPEVWAFQERPEIWIRL